MMAALRREMAWKFKADSLKDMNLSFLFLLHRQQNLRIVACDRQIYQASIMAVFLSLAMGRQLIHIFYHDYTILLI